MPRPPAIYTADPGGQMHPPIEPDRTEVHAATGAVLARLDVVARRLVFGQDMT